MQPYTTDNIILQLLKNSSQQPLENEALIKRYIVDALTNKVLITFFDWECPPRTISRTGDGAQFVNYDIDLDKIFRGETIDRYTELPRAVSQQGDEIRALKYLIKSGLAFRFVKIIADTNAYYITPESVEIMGRERIEKVFNEFQMRIKVKTKIYPVGVEVYRCTELLKPFAKMYDEAFQEAMLMLTARSDELVAPAVIEQQIERIGEHMGIEDRQRAEEIARRVIATYGAEGIVFEPLSKTKALSNCIWMNLRETNARTISMTNCLRKARGQEPLPMWFP